MLRKLLWTILGLFLLLVVSTAGLIGYAQTRSGQERLAALLTDLLSTPEQRIELSGLRGTVPFDLRLERVRLADGEGPWLEAEDVRFVLAARDLLRLAVTVREIGAARVTVHRLPAAGEPPPPTGEPFSLPELPELPETLPVAAIERLHVDRIELGQPVLGTPAMFGLEGHAGTTPEGRVAELDLALRRIDAPTAELRARARLDLPSRSLALDVAGSETGGLLAAVTGRPEAGAVRLALTGEGPLSGWTGRLEAEAERLARAGLDLDLAYAEQKRLGVSGGVDLEPGLLPPEFALVVGPRVDLALRAEATGPQQVRLDRLEVSTASASLSGTAEADLAADTLAARLDLDAPDLSPLSDLAQTPIAGRTHASLTAQGAVAQPELRLVLDAGAIAAAGASLRELAATADITFLSPLGQGEPALRLAARAQALGIAVDGRELGPDGRLELDLAASLPAAGEAGIERLELRSPLAGLTASGAIDRASLAGSGRVDLSVPDLAPLMAAFAPDVMPGEIGGGLGLGADIEVSGRAEAIDVVLDGGGLGLRLPERLLPLIGPTPTLVGHLTLRPGERVTAHGLTLTGLGFKLEADPTFGLVDRTLGGGVRLSVPDLAPLEAVAGQPIEGSLDVAARLDGTVPAADLALDVAARELDVAGQSFATVDLAATAMGDLAAPRGTVRLDASRGQATATLATRYALAGQNLSLSELRIEAPSTRLDGGLEVALEGPRVTGHLAGQVRDLAALQPFTQQDLAGAVALDLRLSAPGGRQDADLALEASNVGGTFGRLQTARLEAGLRDALGTLGVNASLMANDFTAPDLAVHRTTLTAQGPLGALDLRLRTAGEQAGRAFDLDTAATVDAASATRTVRLTTLDAGYGSERARLLQPATARLAADGAVALDRLALTVGGGRLALSGELGQGQVRADADLQGLELARLESFGAPALRGVARAQASLRGSTRAPQAEATVSVAGLAVDPDAPLKPDLTLDASLGGGRLEALLGLTGLAEQPLRAEVTLPMEFALEPFRAELAPDAPLRGRVDGSVDLARALRLAPVSGLQVVGDLRLALGLGGTVARPMVTGAVDLADAALQDLTSGIDLTRIALRIEGRGREIALTNLAATGRTGGSLSGDGNVALLDEGAVRYAARVGTERLRVLNNELGTAIVTSAIEAAGDQTAARVGGTITLDGADIEIPDGSGPSVPVIEVQEVNAGTGAAPVEPAAGATQAPFDLTLDLDIQVPARLFVRGRGLDSEWGGNLSVEGPATAPEIIGELEFRRGFLDLLDRRFEIRRGVISFVGSQPPLPFIDIEAAARSEEIEAVVRLTGPAADPDLELSSEPVLPQDEVLSRLLFGRSVARLTPVQGLRLAAAVDTLRGGGGGLTDMLSALRRGLGVDTLDVGGGATAEESTARAGKYVSDNVFVEIERGVTEGSGKARVQVELTPNLSVNTEVDQQSQSGVGLEYRYDY